MWKAWACQAALLLTPWRWKNSTISGVLETFDGEVILKFWHPAFATFTGSRAEHRPTALLSPWILSQPSYNFGPLFFISADGAQPPLKIFHHWCALKKDEGPCKALKDRYYFNVETHRCELFEYGGCQGNENNFETAQECEEKCLVNGKRVGLLFSPLKMKSSVLGEGTERSALLQGSSG